MLGARAPTATPGCPKLDQRRPQRGLCTTRASPGGCSHLVQPLLSSQAFVPAWRSATFKPWGLLEFHWGCTSTERASISQGSMHPLIPCPYIPSLGYYNTHPFIQQAQSKQKRLLFLTFNVIDCYQGASELQQCIPVSLN